jgi:hypothetical protein
VVALVERVDAGRLRVPGLHGSAREALAEMLWGLRRSGNHRRRGIEVAEQITGGNVGSNSGRRTGRARGGRAWGAPWHQGEAIVGVGRGWGAAGWRFHGGARSLGRRSKAAGGAGGSGRLQCGGRAQGGLKGPIKGEAGDLGVHAPVGLRP